MLKFLSQGVLRKLWHLSSPLRRPLVARWNAQLDRHFTGLQQQILATQIQQQESLVELNLLNECLVRELVRVQYQLANLQQTVDVLLTQPGSETAP